MINVKDRCEYLKHLPTYLGDTMETVCLGRSSFRDLDSSVEAEGDERQELDLSQLLLVEDPEGAARPQAHLPLAATYLGS